MLRKMMDLRKIDGLEENLDIECRLFRLDEGVPDDQGTPILPATRVWDDLASPASTAGWSKDEEHEDLNDWENFGQEDLVHGNWETEKGGQDQEQDKDEEEDGKLEGELCDGPRIEFHGVATNSPVRI